MHASNVAGPSTSKAALETEKHFLLQHIAELESESKRKGFSFRGIENDENLVKLYTGLPTTSIFRALYELLENIPINYYFDSNVENISKIDQLLMCLMKLRQNFSHLDLALRFGVSQATVRNIVITWICVLHDILYNNTFQEKNPTCLPTVFISFTNCRILLDCTEMAITVPGSSMSGQKSTYSAYKHKNTWTALVGTAPNGVVAYVSALYPGAFSEKKIFQSCGILEQFNAGDLMAEEDSLIWDLLPSGVSVNIPPFLTSAQFTTMQEKQTLAIARASERAIQRMKTFEILSSIPRSLYEHAGKIIKVVGALTNLQQPFIDEVSSDYLSENEL